MDVSALSGVIGALNSGLSAANAQQSSVMSVLKNSMDTQDTVALQLIQSINAPGLGQNIDVRA
ncbi:MAG TPA: YjfB family protein [Chloroflexota bacterium]|nr:YjfB family protein [Chloroflexota bacterium]